MDKDWIELSVVTTSEALEPVTGIFYSLDIKGVAIEDPDDILNREQGPLSWDFADINILEYKGRAAVIKAYFNSSTDIDSVVEYIKTKLDELKAAGINIGRGEVLSKEVHEEDWANNWKKYYKPIKIGDKIIIKPLWESYEAEEDEIIVEMDPGMAFGTGTHETTRMCIEALEKYVTEDSTVFDIGTGSGIIGITASKLKAKKVTGVDLDPVAVDSARENVRINKAENVEILCGNLMDVIKGKADIVVANIIAEVIILLAGEVKQFMKEGGYFISSGIIKDKKDEVIEKLMASGFEIVESRTMGEWVCIVSK